MDNCQVWPPTNVGWMNQKLVFDIFLTICSSDGKGGIYSCHVRFDFLFLPGFERFQAVIGSFAMQLAQYSRYLTAVGMSSQ